MICVHGMITTFERLSPRTFLLNTVPHIRATLSTVFAWGLLAADRFTGVAKLKGTLPTALVGSLAAGVAYLIAQSFAWAAVVS